MADSSRLTGFFRGFLAGLSSSVCLYGDAGYIEPAKIETRKLHSSIEDPVEAMRSDWQQVGADIQAAIESVIPR